MVVHCPLTGDEAEFVRWVDGADIVRRYAELDVDVSAYFTSLDRLGVYSSPRTGYRFFHPAPTATPGLYRRLAERPSYYPEDKWDYAAALSDLDGVGSLLEVGCGHGAFLAKAVERGLRAVGTEFSDDARRRGTARGLEIVSDTLDEVRDRFPEGFDVVAAFQVLEHVGDPLPFLRGLVANVRPGGRLIVTVPNNDSLWAKGGDPLDMPPHHVGLWSVRPLLWLQQVLPLRVVDVRYQPLSDHVDADAFAAGVVAGLPARRGRLRRLVRESRFARGVAFPWRAATSTLLRAVPGHSVQVVYERVTR